MSITILMDKLLVLVSIYILKIIKKNFDLDGTWYTFDLIEDFFQELLI